MITLNVITSRLTVCRSAVRTRWRWAHSRLACWGRCARVRYGRCAGKCSWCWGNYSARCAGSGDDAGSARWPWTRLVPQPVTSPVRSSGQRPLQTATANPSDPGRAWWLCSPTPSWGLSSCGTSRRECVVSPSDSRSLLRLLRAWSISPFLSTPVCPPRSPVLPARQSPRVTSGRRNRVTCWMLLGLPCFKTDSAVSCQNKPQFSTATKAVCSRNYDVINLRACCCDVLEE